jgi:hypothetical protein
MSKNTVNQAELNKHHEIIFKIRERMNQMKIDTDNGYPCFNEKGMFIIDGKTFIAHSCKNNIAMEYLFYQIYQKDKDKYIITPFDIRTLCKRNNLQLDLSNLNFSNWNTIEEISKKELKLNLLFSQEINTKNIPTTCEEKSTIKSRLELEIKDDLLQYLNSHTPHFKRIEKDEYLFMWGEIPSGEVFIEEEVEDGTAVKWLENKELTYSDGLKYMGEYDNKLIEWIKYNFFNDEDPTGLDSLTIVSEIVKNWKQKGIKQ